MKRVNIIGFGNTGVTLYKHLKSRIEIVGVFTRHSKDEKDVPFVNELSRLSTAVDLNIICVSDDAISEVAKHLSKSIPVVHTSGGVALSVLEAFDNYGVLYPLQTLSKTRNIEVEKIPFLIESGSEIFQEKLTEFCKNYLSQHHYNIDSQQRGQIHVAAVLANNFSTYLFGVATELLKKNDLPANLLNPLIEETVSKFMDMGYPEAQTGPARRGDSGTIEKHLSMLRQTEHEVIYKLLSEAISKRFIV